MFSRYEIILSAVSWIRL